MLPRNWTVAKEAREDTPDQIDPVTAGDATELNADVSPADIEPEQDADNIPESEVADETPDAELTTADMADGEIDQAMANGDRLASDISDLQTIHSVVADSIGDGGAEESARRVIDVAVESFCKRWDIPHVKVATESFSSSKMLRTRVACESIVEAISKGFNALITWIREICKKIATWFKGLFSLTTRLESRVKSLESVIDHLGDKDGKFSIDGNENIYFNGVPDVDAIIKYVGKMNDHTKMMVADTVDTIWVQRADLLRHWRDGFKEKLNLTWVWEKTLYRTVSKIIEDYGLDVKAYRGVCPMPGENYLFMFEHEGQTKIQYIHGVRPSEKHEAERPTKENLKEALEAAAAYVKMYKERIAESHEFVHKLTTLEAMLEQTVKASKDAKDDNTKELFQQSIKNLRQVIANSQSIQRGMVAGLRSGAVGLLDYVTAGVKSYGTVGKSSNKATNDTSTSTAGESKAPGTGLKAA